MENLEMMKMNNHVDIGEFEAILLREVDLKEYGQISAYELELAGHKIVLAVMIVITDSETSTGLEAKTAMGKFRFAICNQDDEYKAEVGASLAVGRCFKDSQSDFQVNVKGDKDVEVLFEMVQPLIEKRLRSLRGTLSFKNSINQTLEKQGRFYEDQIAQDLSEYT